jgi:hypothetical protein
MLSGCSSCRDQSHQSHPRPGSRSSRPGKYLKRVNWKKWKYIPEIDFTQFLDWFQIVSPDIVWSKNLTESFFCWQFSDCALPHLCGHRRRAETIAHGWSRATGNKSGSENCSARVEPSQCILTFILLPFTQINNNK